jgi:hypothetical protein
LLQGNFPKRWFIRSYFARNFAFSLLWSGFKWRDAPHGHHLGNTRAARQFKIKNGCTSPPSMNVNLVADSRLHFRKNLAGPPIVHGSLLLFGCEREPGPELKLQLLVLPDV